MSCLSVKLTRKGAASVEISKRPSVVAAGLERVRVAARFARVCVRDIKVPYLEIEPTILWVNPDFANSNNVFSNTYWKIN